MKVVLLSVLAGCGLDPLAKVGDSGTAPLSSVRATPSPLDFGAVAAGEDAFADVVLENVADGPITISDSAINSDAGNFWVEAEFSFPLTLQPAATSVVTLGFRDAADGVYDGVYYLKVDGDERPFELPLRAQVGAGGGDGADGADGADGGGDGGNGGGDGGGDGVSLSTSSLNFGSVGTGQTGRLPLTITNNSGADILVTSLNFSDFAFTWTPSAGQSFTLAQVISAGNAKTIDVLFQPGDIRSYTGTLTVETDGGDLTANLRGEGTEPPCTICAPVMLMTGGDTDHSVSINDIFCSVQKTVSITNIGDEDLVLSGATITNDAIATCGGFSLVSGGTGTVAPGASTNLTIAYNAIESCADFFDPIFGATNKMDIANNSSENPYTVQLNATTLCLF